MLAKHKTSIILFITAILVYLVLGLLVPEIAYAPNAQAETGWNAVQAAQSVAAIAAPIVALVLIILAVISFLKELK